MNYKCREIYSKPGRYHLIQVIKVNITSRNPGWYHDALDILWKRQFTFVVFFSKIHNHSRMRKLENNKSCKTFHKIVQKSWTIILSFQVMKDKERWTNHHRLEVSKESWKLNIIWELRLNRRTEKTQKLMEKLVKFR